MAKKTNTELDDFNFDDDIFGDLDLGDDGNGDKKKPKKGPIRTLSTSFAQGARDALLEPSKIKELARSTLPKSYSSTFDAVDAVNDTSRRLYDTAVQELKPILPTIRKAAGKLSEKADGLAPKGLVNLLKEFSEKTDHEYRAPTQEESDNTQISEELGAIFKETAEADAKRSATDRAERYLRYRIQDKQSSAVTEELSRLNNAANRLVAYQDAVTYKYQQKTLENSYRQTFMLRDILVVQKELRDELKVGLTAIVHNTATPDFQKTGVGDTMHQKFRDRMISGAQSQAQKFTGDFFKKISAGMADRLKDSLGSMVGAIEMGQSASEMLADAEEAGLEGGGKLGMVGNGLGGMVADWLMPKVMMPIQKMMGRSKGVNKGGNKLENLLLQIPEKVNKMKRDGVDDISSFGGWMKQMFLDALPDMTVKKNIGGSAIMKADEPVPYDNMSRRSLVEIIPGFLSRIHHEVANIRTGLGFSLSAPRIVYNADSNKFDTEKGAQADMKKRIFESGMLHNVQSSVNTVVDHSDDGSLSASQRKMMAAKILEASQKAEPMDAQLFAKDRMGQGLSEKDRKAIERSYLNTLKGDDGQLDVGKLNDRIKKHLEIRRHTTDMAPIMRHYRENGNAELLRNLGIVQSNGLSEEVNYAAVNKELLDGKGIAPKKKKEEKNWFKDKEREYMEAWERKSEEIADWVESKEWYQNITNGVSSAFAKGFARVMNLADKFKIKDDEDFDPDAFEDAVDEEIAQEPVTPTSRKKATKRTATSRKGKAKKEPKSKTKTVGKKRKRPVNKKRKRPVNMRAETTASVSGNVEDYEDPIEERKPRFKNGLPTHQRYRKGGKVSQKLLDELKAQGEALRNRATPAVEGAKTRGRRVKEKFDSHGLAGAVSTLGQELQNVAEEARGEHAGTIESLTTRGRGLRDRVMQSKFGDALRGAGAFFGRARDNVTATSNHIQAIYAKGGKQALLEAAKLEAGEYRDQLTGKVIKTWDEISGPVIDSTGNVVASAEEIARGLYDQAGQKLTSITTRALARIRGLKAAAVTTGANISARIAPMLQQPATPQAQTQQTDDEKCQCEEHLKQITELNAGQLAMLDQIYQALLSQASFAAGGVHGTPGAPAAPPGFMKRWFGHAGGAISGAGRGAWGGAKLFGGYLKNVYKGLWGGTKLAGQGVFGAASGIARGAWNVISPTARKKRRQSDVYAKGDMKTPVLFKKLMEEGAYLDITTNKVIKTVDDIKGAVKNLKTGNIDLTQDEFDSGITDNVGVNLGTKLKKAINGVAGAFIGYSGGVLALPFHLARQAVRFIGKGAELINEGQDVYLKGRTGTAVMLNRDIKAGKYFDAKTGKRIRSYKDVKGEVYYYDAATKEKRVVITEEEARTLPLVNWRGKPLRTIGQRGLGMLGSAAGLALDSAVGLAKGYAKVMGSILGAGRDAIVGTARGIGRFFNPKGSYGKVEVTADERSIRLLEDIFGLLMDRLPIPKKLRKGSWQEQFNKRAADAASKEKDDDERKQSGGLFGGLKALFGKGKKGLMGLFGLDDEEEEEDGDDGSLLDDAADTLDTVDDLGDINERRRRAKRRRAAKKRAKRMRRNKLRRGAKGKAGRLSRWFGRGGAVAAEGAEVAGVAGTAARGAGAVGAAGGAVRGAGALSGVARGGLRALPVLGTALGVGLAGKEIWDIQHDKTLTEQQKRQGTGGAVGGAGGALAGAAAGAAIGSVVPVVGTAIGGIAGGIAGYYGGDWLGQKIGGDNRKLRNVKMAAMMAIPALGLPMLLLGDGEKAKKRRDEPFRKLRLAQYGVDVKNSDQVKKMEKLEDICAAAVKQGPQGLQLDQQSLNPDEIFELFDMDDGGFLGFFKKNNEEKQAFFLKWFNMRFKPVFLAWQTAMKNASMGRIKQLADAWEGANYEERKKILTSVKVAEDVYRVGVSPFLDSEIYDTADPINAAFDEAQKENDKNKPADGALSAEGAKADGAAGTGAKGVLGTYLDKAKHAYGNLLGKGASAVESVMDKGPLKYLPAGWAMKAFAKILRKGEKAMGNVQGEGKPIEAGLKSGTKLTALQTIRYKAYGLKQMQTNKASSVYILEKNVMKSVTFSASNAAHFSKTSKELFDDYAQYFGIAIDDYDRKDAWVEWFDKRFLPVLLAFASATKAFTNGPSIDIVNVEKTLKPDQKLAIARAMIAAKRKKLLLLIESIWSFTDSPWDPEESLNDNINTTRANIEFLEEAAKNQKVEEETGQKKPEQKPGDKAADKSKPKPGAKADDKSKPKPGDKAADKSKPKPVVPKPTKTPTQSPNVPSDAASPPAVGKERDLAAEKDAAYWKSKGTDPKSVQMVNNRIQKPAKLATGAKIDGLNTDKLWQKVSPLIASGESMGGNYDAQNGVSGNVQPGLSNMTIGEVYENSRTIGMSDGNGNKTGAAGKYQFIPKTLMAVMKMAGLSLTDMFSPENQEKMARAIFDSRVARGLKNGVTGILDQLSMEWASLPSPSKGGASWYAGVAGNRAHGGMDRLQELIGAVTGSYSGGGGAGSTGETAPPKPTAKPNVPPKQTAAGTATKKPDTPEVQKKPTPTKQDQPGFWQRAGSAALNAVTAPARMAYQGVKTAGHYLGEAGKWLGNTVADTEQYAKEAVADVSAKVGSAISSAIGSAKAAKAAAIASGRALGKSAGKCAKYVSDALLAAGYKFTKQGSAYMYVTNGILESIGFKQIDPNSKPAAGDVMVYSRTGRHPHGHIQIFDGSQWISDFRQRTNSPYRERLPCTMWRDMGGGKAANDAKAADSAPTPSPGGKAAPAPALSADIADTRGLAAASTYRDQSAQAQPDRDAQVQQLNQADAYKKSVDQQRDRFAGDEVSRIMTQSLDVENKQLQTQMEMSEKLTTLIDAVNGLKGSMTQPTSKAATSEPAEQSKTGKGATRAQPGFEAVPRRSPLNVKRGTLKRA